MLHTSTRPYSAMHQRMQCARPVHCMAPLSRLRMSHRVHVVAKPVPDMLENVVNLDFGGRTEKITLVDGRIQLSAIKEAFALQTVKVNGRIEPTDAQGFTISRFRPLATVSITGAPTSEMACLFGEIAALRADINKLADLRAELKDSAGLKAEIAELKADLSATKRLVAEIVAMGTTCHAADNGPDFTKTSQDGYTFDTWWEAQCLARDIISGHTQVKPDTSVDIIHHEDHVVANGMHAT